MRKKIFALILAIATLLPMFTVFGVNASAASGSQSSSSAQSSDVQYDDGVYYMIDKHLVYSGNNLYRLDITVSSTLTTSEHPMSVSRAENGYYTVSTTGYYLVELWGGKGASGSSKEFNILGTIVERQGGVGGANGYVYAKLWLEKGQTLAYSIGTNGTQSEASDDGAGGENGEGGAHGDDGSYTVGGGGGYSALYLFNEGEFDPAWVTASALNIPESARLSRYIMIAAGGGGGGGHNSITWENGTTSAGTTLRANGGAGGNALNGVNITLNGGSVPGYIFSGKNGSSSNSSTAHAGKGGSNVPGSTVSTYYIYESGKGDEYFAEPGPNDWLGTYSNAYRSEYGVTLAPGAGGLGNLRGGGGGAGYCGGSGGIMYELLIAHSVGGGGGGSSFLAKTVNGKAVQFVKNGTADNALDAETAELLSGTGGSPSSAGGAIAITFVGGDADAPDDTSFLQNIEINGAISKYFDITYATTSHGTVSYNNSTGAFTVSGANIDPYTLSTADDKTLTELRLILSPKSDFAGGNNVDLLNSLSLSFTDNKGEAKTITASAKPETDKANVALKFLITTNSIMASEVRDSNGDVLSVGPYAQSELYEATHQDALTSLSGLWQYDYIASLTGYSVYEGKSGAVGEKLTGDVAPTETTYYSVCLFATPKSIDSFAVVGPQNTEENEVFYGIACIAVVSADVFDMNSNTVTAAKYLSYDGEAYIFEQEVSQSYETAYGDSSNYVHNVNGAGQIEYVVPQDGYYLVQAWGARGGNGQSAYARARRLFNGNYVSSATYSGGSGGKGASLYGYVWLNAGDKLLINLEDNGAYESSTYTNPDFSTSIAGLSGAACGTYGEGGGYAAISLQESGSSTSSYILIAGGGGGGGGAGAWATTASGTGGTKGGNGGDSTQVNTTLASSMNAYRGTDGTRGTPKNNESILSSSGTTAGSGGAAGVSYRNDAVINALRDGATANESVWLSDLCKAMINQEGVPSRSYNSNTTSGAGVQITQIASADMMTELASFRGLEASGAFSGYFDIQSLEMTVEGISPSSTTTTNNSDGSKTVSYRVSSTEKFAFTYKLTANSDGTVSYVVTDVKYDPTFTINDTGGSGVKKYTATGGFSLVFKLTPKEGFLGGNDVPLVAETSGDASPIVVTQDGVSQNLSQNPATDYANVAVEYDIDAELSSEDKTITLGESVETSELYDFSMVWPSGEDAWKAAFVDLTLPENQTLSPTETTTYPLTVSITPKAAPAKAVVVGATSGVSATRNSTVSVNYPVTYTITDGYSDGALLALCRAAFETTIAADKGFDLPASVEVLVLGSAISAFSYDASSGKLVIEASAVTGPIEIRAKALEKTYAIEYLYYTDIVDPNNAPVPQKHVQSGIKANSTIDFSWFDSFNATLADKTAEGYEYVWEWDTDDGEKPATMPAKNITVTGSYEKIKYLLTVNYVDTNGTALDTHTSLVEYGTDFSVVSPVFEGYVADHLTVESVGTDGAVNDDPFIVSGTMGIGPITVTVTYRASARELTVLYVYPNGKTASEKYQAVYGEGEAYAVTSPTIVGYTPDLAVVSGTMDAVGQTVTVTYSPNRYDVTLKYQYNGDHPSYTDENGKLVDGASINTESATMDSMSGITVEYGNIYGYDAATDGYGLPQPQIAGYTFLGWYTLDGEGNFDTLIDESDTVTITADTTLYAKWQATPYTLTIRYAFEYESGDFLPDETPFPDALYEQFTEYEYESGKFTLLYEGTAYAYIIPTIEGYTAHLDFGLSSETPIESVDGVTTLTGTMPGMNHIVYIVYEINTYEIRFAESGDLSTITYPDYTTVDRDVFTKVWQTLYIKHNVKPVYTAATPSQSTASYSYTFTGFRSSTTGAVYAKSDFASGSASAPAAIEDVTYYPLYTAAENIALVYNANGVLVSYYTDVQTAITAALNRTDGTSTTPVRVLLRRNADVAPIIDIASTTLSVTNSSYTRYIELDLGGITLQGSGTVLNSTEYLYLTDSVGTGMIKAMGSGDIVAVKQNTLTLRIGGLSTTSLSPVTVLAISDSGNAIGVQTGTSSTYLYLYEGSTVTGRVTAGEGNAYGAYANYSTSSYYTYLYGNACAEAVNGIAYGVYTKNRTYFYHPAAITAYSEDGNAYGIYGTQYLNFSTSGVTVTAESETGNVYGVYIPTASSSYRLYMSASPSAEDVNETTVTVRTNGVDKTAIGVSGYLYSALLANISAQASNGTASALKTSSASSGYAFGSSTYDFTLEAIGKNAITVDYPTTCYIYATVRAIGDETAIAIQNTSTTTLYAGAAISAYSENGAAYAFKGGAATTSSSSIAATVSAETDGGFAYGFYDTNLSGTFGTTTPVTVTANGYFEGSSLVSGGKAYGVYWSGSRTDVTSATYNSYAKTTVTAENGDAYGAYITGNTLSVVGTLTVNGKNAYGIYLLKGTLSLTGTVTVSGETAVGIYAAGGTLTANGKVTAKSKNAKGIVVKSTATATVSSSSAVITVETPETAAAEGDDPDPDPAPPSEEGALYGIYVESSGSLTVSAAATVTVTATEGAAYGIYSLGTLSQLSATVTVAAPYEAYGIVNTGSLVKTTTTLAVNATSTYSDAYALCNQGGTVGAEGIAGSINAGVFTAIAEDATKNAYGILGEGGALYLKGVDLYFKGSSEDLALYGDYTICDGYKEQAAGSPYEGYQTLVLIEYTMIFVERYLDGSEYLSTALSYNTEMTSIAEPALTLSEVGYTHKWSAYDFSAPEGEETVKYVYSFYDPNDYTITFVTSGGSDIAAITVTFKETIVLPSNPTKAGSQFIAWYLDEALTVAFSYTEMPAENLTLYAAWEVGIFTITLRNSADGSLINEISDYYGEAVTTPASPTRLGYHFLGWFTDEAGTAAYTFTAIPEESITVWACWEVVKYTAILDGACQAYTVNFYRNYTSSDNTLHASYVTSATELSELSLPANPTRSQYLFRGWYTSRTASASSAVELHGSLALLDTDHDGIVNLYAGWLNPGVNLKTLSNFQFTVTEYSINPVTYDGNENSYGYYYLTYPVTADGSYTISVMNYAAPSTASFEYNKLVQLGVRHRDGTTTTLYNDNMPYVTSKDDANYNHFTVTAKAGDVIVMRIADPTNTVTDSSTYTSTIRAYISDAPDTVRAPLINGSAIVYTVDQGTVTLPTAEGEGFIGYSWKEDGVLSSTVITALSEALLTGTPSEWSDPDNLQVLTLYAVFETVEIIIPEWSFYIEADRRFAAFDTALTAVTIRQNAAFSLLCENIGEVEGVSASLTLENGLPIGTRLTLIDLSGAIPRYYVYTVTVEADELALSSFVLMGTTDVYFSGCSEKMLIAISYHDAELTESALTARLSVNGDDIGKSCAVTTISDEARETSDEQTLHYGQTMTHTLYAPSLSNQGYKATDRVILVIRLTDPNGGAMTLPAGFGYTVSGYEAEVYESFAFIELGRVQSFTSSQTARGELSLDVLRHTGFSGNFVIEMMIVPEDTDLSGGNVFTPTASVKERFTVALTVLPAPAAEVSASSTTLTRGEGFDLILTVEELETTGSGSLNCIAFIYQLNERGDLVFTEYCDSLLDPAYLPEGVSFREGIEFAIYAPGGAVPIAISENATSGKYYVVIYVGDDTSLLELTVVEDGENNATHE